MRLIRKVVHRSLDIIGLQVSQVPRHRRFVRGASTKVRVGDYDVLMPGNSPLPEQYARNRNYSGQLGSLVKTVLTKYSQLRVIDVGANCGDTVAIIKTAADVPVVFIEGDDRCWKFLSQNIKQFNDVSGYKLYLGERSESITANLDKQGWNTTIIPSSNGTSFAVELVSLDDLLMSEGLTDYKILKIDAEGFDCRILRGALTYLQNERPVLTFEYNRDNMKRIGETGLSTLKMLSDIGYETCLFYDNEGRLLLSTILTAVDLIHDLHHYADGSNGAIYYYDICAFHNEDNDIASKFVASERLRLAEPTQSTCSN